MYLDFRSTYSDFKGQGLTEKVSEQLHDFPPRLDSVISDLNSPLIQPLISLAGKNEEYYSAQHVYALLKDLIPIVGNLVGAEETRRYFIAFQNPAEARGTGGLVGAYAIIKIEQGRISVERVGSNYDLELQDEIPVKLPQEFSNLYGDDPAWWPNSNMSPHFPYAAQIWLGLWKKQYGENLDGAIALDPFVLQDILSFVGPVTVGEQVISDSNVITLTLSTTYKDFENDNMGRKEFLVSIIKAVIQKSLAQDVNKLDLAWSMRNSLLSHRVLFFSARPQEQKQIELSPISGALTMNKSNEYRLVLQNTAGNKMDYYIQRSVRLIADSCSLRQTKIEVAITNTALPDLYLPDIYYGRQDRANKDNPDNSTSVTAMIYGPIGADVLFSMEEPSGKSAGFLKRERSRAVVVIPTELAAGQTKRYEVIFRGGSGPLTTVIQPLVMDQQTSITDKCAS